MRANKMVSVWNRFFFRPELPYAVAAARIYAGILIMTIVLNSWGGFGLWLGSSGLYSLESFRNSHPHWKYLAASLAVGPYRSQIFLALLFTSGLCLACGFRSRLFAFVTYVLYKIFLIYHGPSSDGVTGFDLIDHYLLLFVFTESGSVMSLDAAMKDGGSRDEEKMVSPWFVRLLQLHLAFGYLSSGENKLLWKDWYGGRAFFPLTHHPDWYGPNLPDSLTGNLLANHIFSWSVIAVELGLGLILLSRPPKKVIYPILAAGVIFHIFMALTVTYYFQMIMIGYYILYLDPADVRTFAERVKSVFLRAFVKKILPREASESLQ